MGCMDCVAVGAQDVYLMLDWALQRQLVNARQLGHAIVMVVESQTDFLQHTPIHSDQDPGITRIDSF